MVPKAARNRFWGSKRRSRAERFFCPERFGRLFCSDRFVELSGKKICLKQPRERKILSLPDVFGVTRWSEFDFLLNSTRQNALQRERGFFTGINNQNLAAQMLIVQA
jgi:hypothetical protein